MGPGDFARAPARQQGAALLAFMLFVFLAASAYFLRLSNANTSRRQIDATTARALALAKEALIGRAASDDNRPGSLTCPDISNDGVADGVAGNCTQYVGRLPWKTLDVPELLDGNGERLWYALSAGIRDNAAAQPINPSKALELTLDGTANIAAIVFSPGAPLANQTGRPSNVRTDYLDGANADGDQDYVTGPSSATFNDQALAITRDDVFRVVNRRVLGEIRGPDDNAPDAPKTGLRHYHAINGKFPWADSDSDGKVDSDTTVGKVPLNETDLNLSAATLTWLDLNGWRQLVSYQRLSADSARLTIGSTTMDVKPCPSSPCQ
jgi:hypothetical protein